MLDEALFQKCDFVCPSYSFEQKHSFIKIL